MITTQREIKKYNFVSISFFGGGGWGLVGVGMAFYFRPPVFQHGAPPVGMIINLFYVNRIANCSWLFSPVICAIYVPSIIVPH